MCDSSQLDCQMNMTQAIKALKMYTYLYYVSLIFLDPYPQAKTNRDSAPDLNVLDPICMALDPALDLDPGFSWIQK